MTTEPKRKHLELTWLHRIPSPAERAACPPGSRIEVATAALEGGGYLHVLKQTAILPPGMPPEVRAPVALRVSFLPDAGAVADDDERHRLALVPELTEAVHEFARGRVMGLMLDGTGTPEGPGFLALVEVAGAVMMQAPPPTAPAN